MVDASKRAQEVTWSGTRRMSNLAAQVPGAVNLSVGQPDFDTPGHIVEAATRALEEGYTRYTPGLGILPLREAIARKVGRDNRIQADPAKEVMVAVGAIEAIILPLLALVDPGDEVIIADPCYPNYTSQIRIAGGVPVSVSAPESNGFKMSPEDIEKAITKRSRLIIINSPANPTGVALLRSDLEAIAEIAQRHDLFVLSDEAYESLIYDGLEHMSIASLPGMKERTISVFTFSKTYSMTGWRLGYVIAPPKLIEQMHKMQENLVSCVSGFIQQAGIAALDGPQDCVGEMLKEYDRRRRFIVQALNDIEGVTCLMPRGAFYAFPNISSLGRPSEEVAISLLNENKVICVPGTAFGSKGESYLRISYAASMEQLKEGIERLREGLERYRGRS